MTDQHLRPRWAVALAVLAAAFGALTLKSGGEVLFIDGAARTAAGHYVPFVVWFNFLAGFAYIAAGVGLALWRPWVKPLATGLATLTMVVFVAFGVHVWTGGAYEPRTIGAMALRSLVWLGIAFVLRRSFMEQAESA